ncbi:PE-PGRS family protein PE_PGRS26-like, partial [Anopheles cruzii]|uniref:PE-PGRS family protein PE_PGRS26-like n=2 Tax=Anopheles cruzii TaxID=68878 RepID=UPI0022EC5D4B
MLLRVGILVGLCLTLSCAAEDVIPCTTDKGGKGECVKLHLCPDGILNVDGTNIIDIRFNPENECEDYLLKCCPIPDDEDDDRVVEPQTSPTIDKPVLPTTGTTGLTGLATGPNSGPAPHPTAPGTGVPGNTGQSTVPGGLPPTTGDLAAGNLKPPGGMSGGECAGGGSHHGHGCCKGNNACQRPGSPHDEQVDMVGADLLPAAGGKPTSADLTHDSGKPPTVHGGGPLVTGTGLNQIASGGGAPNQKPVGSGTNLAPGASGGAGGAGTQPVGSGVGKPGAGGSGSPTGSGPSQGAGGFGSQPGVGGSGTQPTVSGVGKPGDQKLPGSGSSSGVGGQSAGGPGSQAGVAGTGTQPTVSGVGKPGDQKLPGS